MNSTNVSDSPAQDNFKSQDGRNQQPSVIQVTRDECLAGLKEFVNVQRPGLGTLWPENSLREPAERAAYMMNALCNQGCYKEISRQLSKLVLYDIILLIDDSTSINDEEGGSRKKTLLATIRLITEIYDLANRRGILCIRFLNTRELRWNVNQQKAVALLEGHSFWGTTKIGTMMEQRVLQRFVWVAKSEEKPQEISLERPLLVMTVTDGDIEGEPTSRLQSVIAEAVETLNEMGGPGKDAVSFHFCHIGNDRRAQALLKKIDDSCGNTVDYIGMDDLLKKIGDKDLKWRLLQKLLVGAIVPHVGNEDEPISNHEISNSILSSESYSDVD